MMNATFEVFHGVNHAAVEEITGIFVDDVGCLAIDKN